MNSEEIERLVFLLIGNTRHVGSHGIDMDERVPNVEKLGTLACALVTDLVILSGFKTRHEMSIKAIGETAQKWIDIISETIDDATND